MADDPFTEVLKKLWDLLEDSTEITTLVKAGNRIKYWQGALTPEAKSDETELTYTDLPMVVIVPQGSLLQVAFSSTSTKIQQIYRIKMLDGNLLVHKSYFPLKWALMKALCFTDQCLSLDYVRKIDIGDGVDAKSEEGHPGWALGLDITVTMLFERSALKE